MVAGLIRGIDIVGLNQARQAYDKSKGVAHMKNLFCWGLTLLLAAYSAIGVAETVYVNCPLPQVRADVSTKLPEGWWVTPTEGKLKSLRVQTIGGERVLVCLYQAFDGQVAIMQKVSPGMGACYAEKKHQRFACQPKDAAAPANKPNVRPNKTEQKTKPSPPIK